MKKISCVIFSVMLVVFSLMPVTAFAKTGINSVNYRQIAKDNGIEISEDYTNYFVYSKDVLSNAFNLKKLEQGTFLKKIVSRKLQIVPVIMEQYEK